MKRGEHLMSKTFFLSADDIHLLAEGHHYRAWEKLGAHTGEHREQSGTWFAVWAPGAETVSVVGEFNDWQEGAAPLANHSGSGFWEGFVPGAGHGQLYKYAITSRYEGYRVQKADPFGFAAETSPQTASRIWNVQKYSWNDAPWMAQRKEKNSLSSPLSIYEVHLGSWMRGPDNQWLSYRELAEKLTTYVTAMGFTHVEFLPVTEHPFDGSWGYQPVGYFAPTSRFGTPDDFMHLIDTLHNQGIGVLLDWVPAHFPRDEHGIGFFDGTHLYEHADPRQGRHQEWDTAIFNFGRPQVANFLLASALFWLEVYHVDGLRMDAVASMLYLDYARNEGEWIPNIHGGRENLEAVSFIKRCNELVYQEHPDVLMAAEESTTWPMVSRPTYQGGLGFGLKWNMGWMHDILLYMSHEPIHRKNHHNQLCFSLAYAFQENFLLSLSHDEVVHGKGSLLNKMPGDRWQRFANLRLLLGFMFTHPGKKLLFMGDEFGQEAEWNHDSGLDWQSLEQPDHQGLQRWVRDLNTIMRGEPSLYQLDFDASGFSWIDNSDSEQSVITFLRRGYSQDDVVVCACNFTPVPRHNYRLGVPVDGFWEELLNSDAALYGGSGQGNFGGVEASPVAAGGLGYSLVVTLPPLAIVAFRKKTVPASEKPSREETKNTTVCVPADAPPAAVQEALRVLGIRRLLLGIQDPAFPCSPEEDIGRGSPYGKGAGEFLAFVRSLGFNGVQLGPQGMTSLNNASPYDSTLFSRNRLSLAPLPLTTADWGELLRTETLAHLVAGRPKVGKSHTAHVYACHTQAHIMHEVWTRYQAKQAKGMLTELATEFARFRKKNNGWLIRDGLYETLCHHYGGQSWRNWGNGQEARIDRHLWHPDKEEKATVTARRRTLFAQHHEAIAAYAFSQFLLDRQHRELRRTARHLGLDLFGDLQIGFSESDAWFAQSFLLSGYVMGAPPSRTNPEGQPWNYPLLDPVRYFADNTGRPGPALRFLGQRLDKMLREFDGLRIDHPHGLICPWVYRANQRNQLAAVQAGARLFASPDLPDHPALAPYAIARANQINRDRSRYDDDWVRDLDPEQVARYSLLLDVIMDAARNNGRDAHAIACEILSTQPYPIKRAMERHGLGRFRVTQKADLTNPADVYRSENAGPEDWIMLGNHDTPPIWLLADQWQASGAARQQAEYLAWRLQPQSEDRAAWAAKLAVDGGELVQAKAADLFAGPAGNVMIFFTDLLGMTDIYNRPGIISDDNWSLRIANDFAREYHERLACNRAINLPKALAIAIRARGRAFAGNHDRLLAELDRLSGTSL
jgi:1,4-alpha-glucan branching enzyme